jgi:hypothetical protein
MPFVSAAVLFLCHQARGRDGPVIAGSDLKRVMQSWQMQARLRKASGTRARSAAGISTLTHQQGPWSEPGEQRWQ